jgi:hypothetical protein
MGWGQSRISNREIKNMNTYDHLINAIALFRGVLEMRKILLVFAFSLPVTMTGECFACDEKSSSAVVNKAVQTSNPRQQDGIEIEDLDPFEALVDRYPLQLSTDQSIDLRFINGTHRDYLLPVLDFGAPTFESERGILPLYTSFGRLHPLVPNARITMILDVVSLQDCPNLNPLLTNAINGDAKLREHLVIRPRLDATLRVFLKRFDAKKQIEVSIGQGSLRLVDQRRSHRVFIEIEPDAIYALGDPRELFLQVEYGVHAKFSRKLVVAECARISSAAIKLGDELTSKAGKGPSLVSVVGLGGGVNSKKTLADFMRSKIHGSIGIRAGFTPPSTIVEGLLDFVCNSVIHEVKLSGESKNQLLAVVLGNHLLISPVGSLKAELQQIKKAVEAQDKSSNSESTNIESGFKVGIGPISAGHDNAIAKMSSQELDQFRSSLNDILKSVEGDLPSVVALDVNQLSTFDSLQSGAQSIDVSEFDTGLATIRCEQPLTEGTDARDAYLASLYFHQQRLEHELDGVLAEIKQRNERLFEFLGGPNHSGEGVKSLQLITWELLEKATARESNLLGAERIANPDEKKAVDDALLATHQSLRSAETNRDEVKKLQLELAASFTTLTDLQKQGIAIQKRLLFANRRYASPAITIKPKPLGGANESNEK